MNNIYRLINTLLYKYLGLKLIKVEKPASFNKSRSAAGHKYIEFIGVPGVGKSTLYRSALQSNNKNWIPLSSYIGFAHHMYGIPSLENSSFYQSLAQEKIKNIATNDNLPTDKMSLINYFHNILLDDAFVHFVNKEYTVVSEEGLLHCFTEEIINLAQTSSIELKQYLKNRAVVYCYASAEQIAKQIKERYTKTGKIVVRHKNRTFEQLIKDQDSLLIEKEKLVRVLQYFKVPVLSINTSDNLSENALKVNNFIKDHQ